MQTESDSNGLITRDTCRSCNSSKIIDILNLGDFYLSDFINIKDKVMIPKYPLHLLICAECNLVQLKHSCPIRELYNNHYGYRSGINNSMKFELKDVVVKTKKLVRINDLDIVIDVGANDGTLLSYYPKNLIRVGVEPVEKFASEIKKNASIVITDFFSLKSVSRLVPGILKSKAKIITAISMFYDLDDPNKFVSDIAQILDDNGVFVIQQNYLVGMLQQNAFDNIVHEHLVYYSLTSLEKLLKRHKLSVFDVETRKINGGSFRTYICHSKNTSKTRTKNVFNMLELEKKLRLGSKHSYQIFIQSIINIKKRLITLIKTEVKNGKKIYLYGASTRGNTLLQFCKLDDKLISAAVERNSEKWGKKIASVNIPIISEEQARKDKPDYMLVLPWFFKEEIMRREKKYLENGGQLIFPLPELEVVSRS